MNGQRIPLSEASKAKLRSIVAMIETQLSRLQQDGSQEDKRLAGDLLVSWKELIEQLALGPVPEMRECPVCSRLGMREATVCGYCWTKVLPPPH